MKPIVEFSNVADMLKASPFDPEYDLNKTLTEEIYFEHLHVQSTRLAELIQLLREFLNSKFEPNRVIFLKGYSGNGKTTFLHSFMHASPEEQHIYFDFQEVRSTVYGEGRDDLHVPDQIKLLLIRRLRSMDNLTETLRFLFVHRRALKDADFISTALYDFLSTSEDAHDQEWRNRCIDNFSFQDTFACIFVHCFRTTRSGRKTIFYFDNLDVAPMEYVANRFLVYFQDALSAALHIARHECFADREINFRRDYRFIFCLRDANDAILNAHLADRLGFVRAPFAVSFDAELYRQVAEKRLEFVESRFPDHDLNLHGGTKFSAVMSAILSDQYFTSVFLPLYNNDYREVASLLVRLIQNPNITQRYNAVDYDLRGTLMFGITDSLLTKDFLRDYMTIPADEKEGYCYIDRVLLTVLINSADYRRGIPQIGSGEAYSLFYLVKDLESVYRNIPAILRSIARCFGSYQLNRVHLMTLLNRKVGDVQEFVRTYSAMFDRALSGDDSIETVKIKNELSAILVRLNPAGFTYVRYLLPHFEFYGNLVGNTASLFTEPMKRIVVSGEEMYAFEARIDAVLKQVRKHVSYMKTFFDTRYVAAGITAHKFPASIYCFRHPGMVKVAKKTGHSHTIKIVTAHIDYIDWFRRRLLSRFDSDDTDVRHVNELLVSRIRKYAQLLRQAPDRDIANSFEEQFERAALGIARSNYADRTTPIEREGGRARDE
jgi:energy-coupling factor transporter ATP-binding protein EcfA2